MEFIVYIVLCTLIVMSIGLVCTIAKLKKHSEVTDGVVNHNSLMNKFVFKVNLTRDETIAILLTKCVKDTLTCTFDFDMSTIVFSDFWDNEKYYLVISKCDKFSLLHLELVSFRARRSSIKYKITPFIVNKLNAEVVSFSEYGI